MPTPHPLVASIVDRFESMADPERATAMGAYMRDQFPFLGVAAPARDAALRELAGKWKPADAAELDAVVRQLWARDQREFQYAAGRLVVRHSGRVAPTILDTMEWAARQKSWWDTVDELTHGVGKVVLAHPDVVDHVERWVTDDDFWVARLAILHQLGAKDRVDLDRLGRLCLARAGDKEFFIRKAIGWALREASYRNGPWVEAFLAENTGEFSTLTVREARKALDRQAREPTILLSAPSDGSRRTRTTAMSS
jgi:3-methyladenine DNA glycosylase AlkD